MTPAEFDQATPGAILKAVRPGPYATDSRRHRLAAVGLCRQVWDDVRRGISRDAVEVAERYADGDASPAQLVAANAALKRANGRHMIGATVAARGLIVHLYRTTSPGVVELTAGWDVKSRRTAAAVFRDVFRQQVCAVTFDPRWRTDTAVGLAAGIYADRAFDRLPVLADALEEAGCEDATILAHCRGGGVPVRGCWVVDLVLGKG